MRLLKRDDLGNISFTEDLSDKDIPDYAILSHTWGLTADEVTFEDILNGTGTNKPGYDKIRFCVRQTKHDGLNYFWIDTCCIDKKNNTELSKALISMFRWYSKANKCFVFLSDVPAPDPSHGEEQARANWEQKFRASRWFKRGWTLQELLAPPLLEFFFSNGNKLGTKASLKQMICEITKIPPGPLDGKNLANFTIEERLAWQESRETKEEEDMIYSLFGIFDISMPVLYGEGRTKAQTRLQKELYPGVEDQRQKPIHNLPFYRDPDFVHRGELGDIHKKLLAPDARIALVGLGGVGKSQLAIEVCYRIQDQSPDIWVFWIHSSSAARFDQDIQKLADHVKIPGRQDKNADVFQLVYNWLSDSRRSWFIVLDNVDVAEFLFEPPPTNGGQPSSRPRIEYLPPCAHGSILITTRRQAVTSRLVDRHCVITVNPDKNHGMELLRTKLGILNQAEDLKKLAVALEYMPLAIVQAAAYINQRMPRCSIQEYVSKFEKSDRSKSRLLKLEADELRRDHLEAENSILLTWQISFEHINSTRQSAADLLSLMSFFDYQGIPEFLVKSEIPRNITNISENDTYDSSESSADEVFESDLNVLRDYSFITITEERSVFQMHRLVQLAAQIWLKEKEQYQHWATQGLLRLDMMYPRPEYEHWKECRTLQPHALLSRDVNTDEQDALLFQASICYKSAWFASDQGLYADAEAMGTRSIQIYGSAKGLGHPYTLNVMMIMARIYVFQGRWMEAEKLLLEGLETSTTINGLEHTDTLAWKNDLATTYRKQGRWRAAEEVQLEVLATSRRVLGIQHPDTLTIISNLALIYSKQGKSQEADQLQLEVLTISRTVRGTKHPDTLTSMSNVAGGYQDQGRWNEAEELQLEVLASRRQVLGVKHPDTLSIIQNLAGTYNGQGRWKEAEELQLEVLASRRQILGVKHPDTLKVMQNLAMTYQYEGRWEEAEELQLEVLALRRQVLGVKHPDTLTVMHNLGALYNDQGRYKEAEELQLEVLETGGTILGVEHPTTLISMNNLAMTYRVQGRIQEAQELFEKCLEARTRILRIEHPDTMTSMHQLAHAYHSQGRTQEAQELFEKCLEASIRNLGADHPDTQFTESWVKHVRKRRRPARKT